MKIIFLILMFSQSRAESLTSVYVKRLAKTANVSELRRLRISHRQLTIARRACALQLRHRLAPVACYEAFHLESRFGIRRESVARRQLVAKLDDLCRQFTGPLPRAWDARRLSLSPACARHLQNILGIQEYREDMPLGPDLEIPEPQTHEVPDVESKYSL